MDTRSLTRDELTALARVGCGGDDIRWTFSEAGLRRTLRAYGLLCAREQMERDAAVCETVARHTTAIDGTSFYVATGQCAAAIRSQPEPAA